MSRNVSDPNSVDGPKHTITPYVVRVIQNVEVLQLQILAAQRHPLPRSALGGGSDAVQIRTFGVVTIGGGGGGDSLARWEDTHACGRMVAGCELGHRMQHIPGV